jgi:hypothetical protein
MTALTSDEQVFGLGRNPSLCIFRLPFITESVLYFFTTYLLSASFNAAFSRLFRFSLYFRLICETRTFKFRTSFAIPFLLRFKMFLVLFTGLGSTSNSNGYTAFCTFLYFLWVPEPSRLVLLFFCRLFLPAEDWRDGGVTHCPLFSSSDWGGFTSSSVFSFDRNLIWAFFQAVRSFFWSPGVRWWIGT